MASRRARDLDAPDAGQGASPRPATNRYGAAGRRRGQSEREKKIICPRVPSAHIMCLVSGPPIQPGRLLTLLHRSCCYVARPGSDLWRSSSVPCGVVTYVVWMATPHRRVLALHPRDTDVFPCTNPPATQAGSLGRFLSLTVPESLCRRHGA